MEARYTKAKIEYRGKRVEKEIEKNLNLPKVKFKINYRKISLYLLPIVFFATGLLIMGSQIFPSAKFLVESKFSPKYSKVLSPIPEDEIEEIKEFNLGGKFESQYFADILSKLDLEENSDVAGARIPYRFDWEGQFDISIPSVEIEKMPVSANVNSYDEQIYNEVLKNSLAHFKGTDLPTPPSYQGSSNTFIYGHSAPSSWAAFHKNSFEAAFNSLFDLNIGDEIIVNFEEEELKYKVIKITITKPEDLSTLRGIPGKKTLTLMTCAPPGSTSGRLNVIAALME